MSALGVLLALTAAVFAWGALSARLERADLTAPIVFVTVGLLIAAVFPVGGAPEVSDIRALTEVTLVWVLFSDAARVSARELRADAGLYLRLLGVALPLTVLAGWLSALLLLPALGIWLALFLGAALAPTDAALGAVVISHPAVPVRVRRVLNVESGLNDGIVTPVVLLALAGAVDSGHGGTHLLTAVLQLLAGAAIGVATGMGGGWVLRRTIRDGATEESFAGPAVLALALLAYGSAVALHGNGFVAAFAAGIAFAQVVRPAPPRQLFYVEQTAGLASLLVWALFGAIAVPHAVRHLDAPVLLYAVLSLTAVRMVPVALTLVGARLDWRTVAFIGWFGPRGLASVVFALLALEEIGTAAARPVAVVVVTVLLSVLAHGVTAGPLASRYGARAGTGTDPGGLPQHAARLGGRVPAR